MSNLKETLEKIKSLEAEKQSLLAEIEGLKKIADNKAVTLENEVASLREEAKITEEYNESRNPSVSSS